MSALVAQRLRNWTRDILLKNSAGGTITPDANDQVRMKIGREGEAAQFSVTSGTPTGNGSTLTAAAPCRLRIDASDLDFEPGGYNLVVEFYDYDDAADWKEVSRYSFTLEEVPTQ